MRLLDLLEEEELELGDLILESSDEEEGGVTDFFFFLCLDFFFFSASFFLFEPLLFLDSLSGGFLVADF